MFDPAGSTAAEGRQKSEGYCPIPVHLQGVFRKKAGYGGTHYPFDSPLYKGRVDYK